MAADDELMAEILAHPDDDAPRIVYADWLLAHTTDPDQHARAELIHAQCALEKAHASERPALQERARAILKEHRRKWTLPLARAGIRGNWRFRRGFLHGGTMSATRFVAVAEQMFELAPMLRSMVFPEASNELEALASCRYLARLDDVDLHQLCRCGRCKIERELPSLFASPYTTNIRTLSLADCRIEHDNAVKLFESPHLRECSSLDLADNQIHGASLRSLAARGGSFDRLVLTNNPIGDEGAKVLSGADNLEIRVLDLASCGITEVGAAALANAPWADGISELDLHGNQLGKGAPRAALRTRFGRRLRM